jgi:hypothetical protein
MGTIGVFFPSWYQEKLEDQILRSQGAEIFDEITDHYFTGKNGTRHIRTVGFAMYAMAGFLTYWVFFR